MTVSPGGVGPPAQAAGPARLEGHDARRASDAPASLRDWNDAAALSAADVHVAARLGALGGESDDLVLLGAAFAVRAVRLGHVCVELGQVAATTTSEIDPGAALTGLPWPDPGGWEAALASSPLVDTGDDERPGRPARPLRLVGGRLYLDRYWRQELFVAADLTRRAAAEPPGVAAPVLADGLARLFPGPGSPADAGIDLPRLAAVAAVAGRFAVIAGGPGTGKTTTVAKILALLHEQAGGAGAPPPRVALAAPTGKAAARLAEAVHDQAGEMQVAPGVAGWLRGLEATTIHRLLGWRPDSSTRFRHDRNNRLPHSVVIVDETSMLSLSLMAKLLEAVRPDSRLILVGDPQQLASVEAGAVLGDVVGPASGGMRISPPARERLAGLAGVAVPATDPPPGRRIGDGIVTLRRVHRFGGGIAELAGAVAAGDADGAVRLMRSGGDDLRWLGDDGAEARPEVVANGRRLVAAARAGRGAEALAALNRLRVLCAYRHGPSGVGAWNDRIEGWLSRDAPGFGAGRPWYPGRPLLVTENDYELRLFNGDTGVVVAGESGAPTAVFDDRGSLREVPITRLGPVETLHAMTVHKSQGSQFDEVVVVLPAGEGPVVTRELLYTAVTRARRRVSLVGSEDVLRSAVTRPVARSSGLRRRLWGS